jgi:glutathione S-transferase
MNPERIIYIVNGSIGSWQVLITLSEKGLSFDTKRVRVMRSEPETKTPEFLALNPRGQAPLIVESNEEKAEIKRAISAVTFDLNWIEL